MSGKYIVVFKSHVTQAQIDQYADDVKNNGGDVTNRFNSVLHGFAANIPDQYLLTLKNLQNDVIDYIEPDGFVTTQ